ncbi:RluA family pseudouridine synthase [Treponema sp. OMZ 857]|uniref:RluA family pseudouridine synthase n=1 Tax=Treponema sp. OMZ 857 TaxID=1643513 RepID=UPI0020A260D8|nr:RluA family pseudouridine synthase [Treponema sp. OMZ 857]UTC44396.1 RluA family pseudouridine synthase [Treponema sp. OMZ 857]
MCKETTRIYFEDDYCAVAYKASGENSQTFFAPLFPHKPFVAPVNRLDTPVSGIVLLAFSAQIQTLFSRTFEAGAVQKEYWAICERSTEHSIEVSELQRLEHWLGFHTKTQKAFVGAAPIDITPANTTSADITKPKKHKKSALKKAVLYWTLCGEGDRYDFIRIRPETGRTHQIRVQMAAAGHPIKGDLKYGARRSESSGGIRLHSYKLSFIHPITHQNITVEAPPMQPDTLWHACMAACANSIIFTNKGEADAGADTTAPATLPTSHQIDAERHP